jgi:signal transduction histidine kinase
MKLHSRLSLVVTTIILITSIAVGAFSINSSYRNQLNLLDSIISKVVEQLKNSQEDSLLLATYLADESDLNFSVSYVSAEGSLISLNDNELELIETPSIKQIRSSLNSAITIDQVRVRSFEISENEFLLLYYSLIDTEKTKDENIKYLIIFTFLIMFFAFLSVYLIFRKDFELNSIAKTLQKNQEKMKNFIGDASHELKTPLTVIKGYFELLEKTNSDIGKADKYRQRIHSEILRMQEIIDDLLLITELDELREAADSPVCISDLIEKHLFDLGNLQPSRVLKNNIAPEIYVRIKEFYLDQLFSNIFSNIIRYTPENSKVEVNLTHSSNQVQITIDDSGPGLPNEYYSDGIQAFSRFDKSRSRESGGSGLGMTIIHKIVNKNDGSVKLSLSKFGGLRMTITLTKG